MPEVCGAGCAAHLGAGGFPLAPDGPSDDLPGRPLTSTDFPMTSSDRPEISSSLSLGSSVLASFPSRGSRRVSEPTFQPVPSREAVRP